MASQRSRTCMNGYKRIETDVFVRLFRTNKQKAKVFDNFTKVDLYDEIFTRVHSEFSIFFLM